MNNIRFYIVWCCKAIRYYVRKLLGRDSDDDDGSFIYPMH